MFNFRKNAADEIFDNMQKIEQDKEIEEQVKAEDDLVKAMDNLNAAANFFEAAGLTKQATDITELMISIAAPKKKAPKKAPKTKEEKKVFRFYGFTGKDLQSAKDKKSDGKKVVDKKKNASRLNQLISLGQAAQYTPPEAPPASIQKPPYFQNPSGQNQTPVGQTPAQGVQPAAKPVAPKPAAAATLMSPSNRPLNKQQIEAVQDTLNNFQGTKVDGMWGPLSNESLKKFQSRFSIAQNGGKLDNATLNTLILQLIDIKKKLNQDPDKDQSVIALRSIN
jgi:hypothetical protein